MKIKNVTLVLAVLCTTVAVHAEKIVAGPKGGRLLEAEPNKAEFFVNAARRVEITFYDAAFEPIAPGTQVVTVTAEPAGGKTPLQLEETATGFVSKDALPSGEPYRIVVQTRANPDAKPKNFRVDLNLSTCGGCSRAEYACVCDSH